MIFQGELAPEELSLVIGVGLNWLMKQGALPMIVQDADDIDAAKLMEPGNA